MILRDEWRRARGDALASLRFRVFRTLSVHGNFFHHLRGQRPVGVIGRGLRNFVYRVHAFRHFSERRVSAVEMRACFMHDEELAARGVRHHGAGHGEHALGVSQVVLKTILGKFAFDAVAGTPHAVTVRASALNHKAVYHAVENQAVIVALADQADKVIDRIRRDFGIKLCLYDVAVFHFDGYDWICHSIPLFCPCAGRIKF